MHTWQLQMAKSRFSEVVERTIKEGPQLVTRRGQEAVVMVSAAEYRRLSGQTPHLMDCLLNAPRVTVRWSVVHPEAIRGIDL